MRTLLLSIADNKTRLNKFTNYINKDMPNQVQEAHDYTGVYHPGEVYIFIEYSEFCWG
jgi:hypothetical protein